MPARSYSDSLISPLERENNRHVHVHDNISEPRLPSVWKNLNHPLHRTRFSQCQALSAVLR